jgi:hypothetical protein
MPDYMPVWEVMEELEEAAKELEEAAKETHNPDPTVFDKRVDALSPKVSNLVSVLENSKPCREVAGVYKLVNARWEQTGQGQACPPRKTVQIKEDCAVIITDEEGGQVSGMGPGGGITMLSCSELMCATQGVRRSR